MMRKHSSAQVREESLEKCVNLYTRIFTRTLIRFTEIHYE